MVEKSLIDWLTAIGYAAYSTVPFDRPQTFVTVDAAGGGGSDTTLTPLVTVDVWDETRGGAAEKAYTIARAAVDQSRRGEIGGIGRVDVNASPYWAPDPDTRQPRYRMLLEVALFN